MNIAFEFLKGAATVVGGTALVFGCLFAVVLPIMLLNERLRAPARRRRQGSTDRSEFKRLRSRMLRLARPTQLLVPAKTSAFSKLGGAPELPEDLAWPTDHGWPRTFVGQIDMKDLGGEGGLEWLPSEGRLYAFVDETRYGFPDLVRILFNEKAAGPPGPGPGPGPAKSFQERRVTFQTYRSLPSLDWLDVDLTKIDVSAGELDQLASMPDEPFSDEIQHRVGGYPSEIQGDRMGVSCELIHRGLTASYDRAEVTQAIERASKQWRLLLQIDSDPALGMNWGDGGRLYVFIREKDALAGDFSRTITISQTY